MKAIYLLILSVLTQIVTAQDIKLDYIDKSGKAVRNISIPKGTRILSTEDVESFKTFTITVKNLPASHKILVLDDIGDQIGLFTGDGNKSLTAGELSNKRFTIIHEDDKGIKEDFAIVLVQVLSKSKFSLTNKIPALLKAPDKVCEPCKFKGNALTYDFSNNSITHQSNLKWFGMNIKGGYPLVGKPFSFIVININPFRDSVVIGSETVNFNTDAPELFNKAFSAPALEALNKNQLAILADVFELGEQIKRIISALKDAKECIDICSIIQQTKIETEKHFAVEYQFDSTKTDLISFILQNMDAEIDPLHRDSVSKILNDYRNFYNARNYFNYNIPQIQNVDQYIFTLSVLPKAGVKSHTIVDRQPITINTVGGVKFDFSSGLFVTKLRDQRFSLRPDSSIISNSYGGDSLVFNKRNQILQLNDEKKLDFGIAALMHFYPRVTTYINFGLTLGAGVSIGPNPAIRYLGGGSLLFGKSGRLGVSYGCAAGFVDVLADGYQNQQYISLSDAKAVTKKAFKTSNFWAVTFNIPLFKSKVKTEETKKEETESPTKEGDKKDTTGSDADKK